MGMAPSIVRQMPARDIDLLARFWSVEPWGPWRDNLHAAVIAREIRRPQLRNPRKNDLTDFLVVDPDHREEDNQTRVNGLFTLLKTVSTKVHVSKTKKHKRKHAPLVREGSSS